MTKKVLIVVTNHTEIHEGRTTGIWLSEFAEAYLGFANKGYEITVASPLGGIGPIDPGSINDGTTSEILATQTYLKNTLRVDEVSEADFDAIFLPGGHGTMFDLPRHQPLHDLIARFDQAKKVIAAVCHGPAGLVGVTLADGQPLVSGKRVTAFTDQEEASAKLDKHVPFLLESKLRDLGAVFVAGPNWSSHVEVDGNLITGQNPQSTIAATNAVIEQLG